MKEKTQAPILKMVNVVMLEDFKPNKKGQICKFDYGLAIAEQADMGYKGQHLYLTLDEKIKENDWYINFDIHEVPDLPTRADYSKTNEFSLEPYSKYCKKIIATTNPELWHTLQTYGQYEKSEWSTVGIPRIPSSFIEAYVKAQGSIDKVNIEYEEKLLTREVKIIRHLEANNKNEIVSETRQNIIKLRPDRTVTIWAVKEKMYTRKEFEEVAEAAYAEGMNTGRTFNQLPTPRIRFRDWFNENYLE